MPSRTVPTRSRATTPLVGVLIAAVLLPTQACQLRRRLPWVTSDTIVASDASLPPIALESVNDLHAVTFRARSGGWTIAIDRTEIIQGATRLYVTIRRPDPAFSHTQALVDLHALSNVPSRQPVEVVARVLDHDADPNQRVYARVDPAQSLDG